MQKSNKKSIFRAFLKPYLYIPISILIILPLILILWTLSCEKDDHRTPTYTSLPLSDILASGNLSDSDYDTLFRQTGLAKPAIDYLTANEQTDTIYTAQKYNFSVPSVRCQPNTFITREERIIDEQGYLTTGMPIPYVEDGDILITYCSHFFGWRNGHAAIVVDAEERLTLEAQVLGRPSCILSLDSWEKYPTFLILRLSDADQETRAAIAAYAREYLNNVPYRLIAGIFPDKVPDDPEEDVPPSSTHCSHLVWYVFNQFGFDLDSDGGIIVTPNDIANSPMLEIVQSYGF